MALENPESHQMTDHYEKNILGFGNQLRPGNITARYLGRLKGTKPKTIVIIGMGGSGIAGEILRAAQKELGISAEIILWKDYGFPPNLPADTLYIFVSFSGDTEETLSGLSVLLKKPGGGRHIAAVTSGGALKRLGETHQLPIAIFPAGDLTPRQGTGIMFISLVILLRAAGFRAPLSAPRINPESLRRQGERLARILKNKVISIYTDEPWKALGYIWKIKLNETAKSFASVNVIPESNHNEIVGFERKSFPAAAIFLKNPAAAPQFKKRLRITEKLLKQRGVSIIELELKGKTFLQNAWHTIILADWTAYSLARLRGVNPTETKIIAELKADLKKR